MVEVEVMEQTMMICRGQLITPNSMQEIRATQESSRVS
jgi:hypothetical protein